MIRHGGLSSIVVGLPVFGEARDRARDLDRVCRYVEPGAHLRCLHPAKLSLGPRRADP
jgi:hypothetical protein